MDTSKIIKGVVNSGRYTVTAPIVKEDHGLYLQIEGVELPSTYEVDFSNSEHSGTSVTMIGNADGVLIPSQFISTGKDVFAFLYHVGEDFGRTVYKFRIPNKLRPDRTDEEPTPEEQSLIDQAISALNSAVAQTAQDVIDADASAQSAQGYTEQAEDARDNAQTYSNNAQTSANNASASAQASAQSATASANSATTAQGYANTASASAQSASTSASDALTYANTASSKASEASTSASTASAKATESAQSASQALSYKTDAEQAKTASQTAQGLAESARDTAVSAKTDAESARDDAVQAKEDAESAVASIADALDEKAPVITDTASGAIASFSDGADNLPLKSLVVDINPIQDLSHGDPSPENICPISGWTEVQTTQAGSNLWNPVPNGMAKWNPIGEQIPSLTTNFTTFENDVLSVNANWAWNGNAFITNKLLTGRTYRVTGVVNSNSNRARIGVYTLDANRRVVRIVRHVIDNGNMDVSVTMGASDVYICVSAANATDNEAVTITNPCISESGVYEPYTGRSVTIDLGQTVYGGKLDVLSGELVIDRAMVIFDGTEDYDNRFFPTVVCPEIVELVGDYSKRDYIIGNYCSAPILGFATAAAIYFQWRFADTTFGVSSADELKALFAQYNADGNPMTVVYPLATPITIQLTPNQLNSLYGVNNLWADSGDTEVEYRADTKAWIQRKIAEAIASLS